MKKLIFIVLILVSTVSFAHTWQHFGPKGNKVCLFRSSQSIYGVIITDSGFYFTPDTWMPVWEFHEFSLPIMDVALLDDEHILIVAGFGTYSDGIYKFNVTINTIEVVQYRLNPKFITRGGYDSRLFVGHGSGLLESEDGITWISNSSFSGKCCIDMATYFESGYLAIATDQATNNVYYSQNDGANWTQIQGDFQISEVEVNATGRLTGICSNPTPDCGFYRKNETQWENEFHSDKINTLGADNSGTPFIGWYGASGDEKGIAGYTFDNPNPGLQFLNEGLPDLNILDISSPDNIGENIIYCCTEQSTFYCNDFDLGVPQIDIEDNDVIIYPNPVSKAQYLHIAAPNTSQLQQIKIYAPTGSLVKDIHLNTFQSKPITINTNDLKTGTYYVEIIGDKRTWSKKFIQM